MEIYFERIKPLFDSSGLESSALEREIGLPRGKIYDWNSGRVKSYDKYLPQIAAYFHVPVDYLTGASDEKTPAPVGGDGLSAREWELILKFRAAPESYRASAEVLLESAPPSPQAQDGGESTE